MDFLSFSDELRGFEVRRVILSTKQWAALALPVTLRWTVKHFASSKPTLIPSNKTGVYSFVVQPGIADHPNCAYLLYVGKAAGATGFRARYYKYRAEKGKQDSVRPLVNRMINKWYEHLWFCFAEVADPLVKEVEDKLLLAYLPPINTEFPGEASAGMRAFG